MNMANSGSNPSIITPDDWERIARYITGEASGDEAEATDRWAQADPDRARVVDLLRSKAGKAYDYTPDVDVERALAKVKARFDEPKVIPLGSRQTRNQDSRSLSALLRIAAAVIVLLGATTIWARRQSHGIGAAQTYATSIGERREISLNDGTRVLLGPTSRLVVLPADESRGVALDGIAYFNVMHDPAHPFTVKAGSITIQDVGTAFSVENDDSAGTRVAVDSGVVAIGASDHPVGSGGGAVLHARDRAIADPSGTVAVERAAVSDDDLAWVHGRLVFRDAPLVLVGAELYRWYGVRLRVADSSLANLHLTASFSGEPVDRVLNVIALSLGAQIERQGSVAILQKAPSSGARP